VNIYDNQGHSPNPDFIKLIILINIMPIAESGTIQLRKLHIAVHTFFWQYTAKCFIGNFSIKKRRQLKL
jgi:hypothetical protein